MQQEYFVPFLRVAVMFPGSQSGEEGCKVTAAQGPGRGGVVSQTRRDSARQSGDRLCASGTVPRPRERRQPADEERGDRGPAALKI